MARVIREIVSDAILNHLNDPRITGFVSVTRVDVMADMRSADVFLSVMASTDSARKRTHEAVVHARPRIQSILADAMESKFCPTLRFHEDEQFRKTLGTMRLIDEVASEHQRKDAPLEDET